MSGEKMVLNDEELSKIQGGRDAAHNLTSGTVTTYIHENTVSRSVAKDDADMSENMKNQIKQLDEMSKQSV